MFYALINNTETHVLYLDKQHWNESLFPYKEQWNEGVFQSCHGISSGLIFDRYQDEPSHDTSLMSRWLNR